MGFPVVSENIGFEEAAIVSTTLRAVVGQGAKTPDGSLWRYCKAGAAITNPILAVASYLQPYDCTSVTAAAIATFELTVGEAAAQVDGYYANGCVLIGGTAPYRQFLHVRTSKYLSATSTKLFLEEPLWYAVAGTEWVTLYPSMYLDVRSMGTATSAATYDSPIGWPLKQVASGSYFWAIVRGRCWGVVTSTVPGAAANDRQLVVNQDGSLVPADERWNAGTSEPTVGILIPRTGGTYGGGDQLFLLHLE